jgi:hypothetical protein
MLRKQKQYEKTRSGTCMFDSLVRSSGDKAGVFEHDCDTGYFYLFDIDARSGKKVTGAIRIINGKPSFPESEVRIVWDSTEEAVGLFICGQLWAVFDLKTGMKWGGDYKPEVRPEIPESVVQQFVC